MSTSVCVCVCVNARILKWILQQAATSLSKIPILATHWTMIPWLSKPLQNAVHVKAMRALSKHDWATVTRLFAVWATIIKGLAANTTCIIICLPSPHSHSTPTLDRYLHRCCQFRVF
eukprot:m.253127 g.253127  ORF g.253127 m.253127 type:complete len:117 (+) comp15479_c0_seq8:425-775(+)